MNDAVIGSPPRAILHGSSTNQALSCVINTEEEGFGKEMKLIFKEASIPFLMSPHIETIAR